MRGVYANEILDGLMDLHRHGEFPGYAVGFPSLDELYRVKPGCTTYITGTPSHGKTQFLFEVLMRLAVTHGQRHVLFTPETGDARSVWAKLISTYTQKHIGPQPRLGKNPMTELELIRAAAYLSTCFMVVDDEHASTSPEALIAFTEGIKKEFALNTLTLDPWNELDHDFTSRGGREDKYLEYTLGGLRRAARANNIHIFVVVHPKTPQKNQDGSRNPPDAYDMSGGASWYNKAEAILCVHRPDENQNLTEIRVQKAKPEIIGMKGTALLKYDRQTGRYSEWYGLQELPVQSAFLFDGNKF